jgi:hypothetical protein
MTILKFSKDKQGLKGFKVFGQVGLEPYCGTVLYFNLVLPLEQI